MKENQYRVILSWDVEEQEWLASIPALRGCIAYGKTAGAAAREVLHAARGWVDAASAHGKPIPRPDATLERLSSLAPILKMSRIAQEAGISAQTLASKIKRGTPLSDEERESLSRVLASHGVA